MARQVIHVRDMWPEDVYIGRKTYLYKHIVNDPDATPLDKSID